MNATRNFGYSRLGASQMGRQIWTVLIVAGGVCLSPFFACAAPFAALATLAVLKLGWRRAVAVVGLVWLANQAIGYGFLGYPWSWDSAAWGLAIGASSGLALLAASGLSITRRGPLAVSLPFVAAFAAFELGLYAAGYLLPGVEGAFTASVVGHVFLINAVALCALMVAGHLAEMSGRLTRNDASALRATEATIFR